ncbi:cortical protein marker for cell polarity-domain-containing protein [Tricladium varicosporioides]|nr:cortical protein marker for cell polarity-domain-containing protein [Hymenoscyphus varicosporioides]
MKLTSWLSPAGEPPTLLRWAISILTLARCCHAINFNAVPSANLDLSALGRVGLAGDFNGISLYQFEGQNENGFNTNGSQSILSRFPNGGFANLAAADGGIQAMCAFVTKDGTFQGVVVGGNFTSLGGKESQGVAMFNTTTSQIVPLAGLSGKVNTLLCDQATSTVYVGGEFQTAESKNAIAWVGTAGWTNLPFRGFNAPVTSITKAANNHIIFGGSFTGLLNSTATTSSNTTAEQQIINLSTANITAVQSSTTTGFSDPKNIVCKTDGVDGAGNTWLLADNVPGSWKATFGFGFQPTRLRLWNTHQNGRGTKTWRYTAFPINGIMNFTFIDPTTGQNASCSSECPLSSNSSVKFQDFYFVNLVGMNSFQIDISAFYGSGGGLDGIELFEDDIFSYAINDFNEPTCASITTSSTATSTGPWVVTPSQSSSSNYLTASVTSSTNATVVFQPDIKVSGNYSVNIYTPGCLQDDSCLTRGRVNITGTMASGTANTFTGIEIFQTNNFDKFDQIFFGHIQAGTGAFRPSVTLTPSAGQSLANQTVVAQRVKFILVNSTAGVSNIFEYDPTQATINAADFANSTFDKAGMSLGNGSVTSLATSGSTTFVGGNFSTTTSRNILQITDSGSSALPGGSLNGQVTTMFLNGTTLYVGGTFTNTTSGGINGLSHVAAYDTSKNTWAALGAGVNGLVTNIVPLSLNVTANSPETVITITGGFTKILAFGSNSSITVTGFAVWVPSRSNWLQNLDFSTVTINGVLSSAVDLPGGGSLLSGSLSSSQLGANGAVQLSSTSLTSLPIRIQPSQSQASSSLAKRAVTSQNVSGVVTGLFYENGGRNVTILGGHFSARASNGSTVNNLVFINGSNSDTVTGVGSQISSSSTFLAMAVQEDNLFAGGSVTGTVNNVAINGLISYNLATTTFNAQPPALGPGSVAVKAVAVRPNTQDVYVGGNFAQAGSLGCPGVCFYSTTASQWNRPGSTLGGDANAMIWASATSLIVGGSLTINNANVSVATYDAKAQNWTAATGASNLPGPVTAMTAANSDASQLWLAGTATNGSSFLMKFDGTNWTPIGNILSTGTKILGLQVLTLTKNHAASPLLSVNQALMVTGALNLTGFGNASAALFNGTSFQPFALTTTASNTGGSLSQFFTEKQNFFAQPRKGLAKGFVVLIALAIALGLIFFMVVAGVIAERIRRKREGYIPAPTNSYDRSAGISRVPPEQLFGSLGQSRVGVEKQSAMI